MTNQTKRDKSKSAVPVQKNLKTLRKGIYLRVALVFAIIALTLVMIFSLTVAWYTNVVQSSSMTFTAEVWNFEGEVSVSSDFAMASPGSQGVISMSLENDSPHLAAASVTVEKSMLKPSARNKLFFYVDVPTVRNGEAMERVYLSANGSYTYTLFPYGKIAVTETMHNAARIMWEWPYDTLGYYVIGKPAAGGMDIYEYIRPISYAYDPQKTTFGPDGELLTIDGTVSAEEFLIEVSKTDGYSGTISPELMIDGYYMVDVDAQGYGVWARLCSEWEIQNSSEESTQFGMKNAEMGSVSLEIIGQNSREEGISVSSVAELQDVIDHVGVSIVRLEQDLVLSEPLEVGNGSCVMLDMQGNTLTADGEAVVVAKPGSNVMLYQGSLDGTDGATAGIAACGATVTLNQVVIENVDEGLTIFDQEGTNKLDSTVRLFECTVVGREDGLWLKGNGNRSDADTVIMIENSTVEGTGYAGIICNGTYYGYDIRVCGDSVVKGKYTSIYFPTEGTLTVENSTLEGGTGLVVKGGTVYIIDSVITGIGAFVEPDPENLPMSGWIDTGDGIYLEANYTNWQTNIYVSGDQTRVVSNEALAIRKCPDNVATALISVSGGLFSSDVSPYLADSYRSEQLANGLFTVVSAAE